MTEDIKIREKCLEEAVKVVITKMKTESKWKEKNLTNTMRAIKSIIKDFQKYIEEGELWEEII